MNRLAECPHDVRPLDPVSGRCLLCMVAELKAENNRLKLKLFHPVDEDAGPGEMRENFQRINLNFEMCNIGLAMINVGVEPDDATGDTIRNAWIKVNENFAEIEAFFIASPKS